jgi:hypothetical protein
MATSYIRYPLELPLADGGDDFTAYPLLIANRVLFAERFRRQGKVVYGLSRWGKSGYPVGLSLNNALSITTTYWHRDAEPKDLSAYATLSSGFVPHGYWKWRIYCEPKGLVGAVSEIDNPAGGGGASIMAEDFFTANGVLTNLPTTFSAPNPNWNFIGGLQYGRTTDGGSTIDWSNPVWN